MAPGIKIEVFGTGFKSLVFLHWWYEEFSDCIHHGSTWSGSNPYMISLATDGLRESPALLSSFISPRCLFLGEITSLELVFIIVHNKHNGNFSPKI